jgi:hypothetical protein
MAWLCSSGDGCRLELDPMGRLLGIVCDEGDENGECVTVELDAEQVRLLIQALQNWLAKREGMG